MTITHDTPTRRAPAKGPGSTLSDRLYSRVCDHLIAGESLQKVSLETGVSDYTVKAIKGRIRDEIPDWKKNTSRKMEKLITELIESLQNDLTEGRLSPDRKAIAIGILIDKREKLCNGTRRVNNSTPDVEGSLLFSQKLRNWISSLSAPDERDISKTLIARSPAS